MKDPLEELKLRIVPMKLSRLDGVKVPRPELKVRDMSDHSSNQLLTIGEAARILAVPTWHVRRLCQSRRLAFVQVSPRKRMFAMDQIKKFIENSTVEAKKGRGVDKMLPSLLPSTRKGGLRSGEDGKSLAEIRKELRGLCQ